VRQTKYALVAVAAVTLTIIAFGVYPLSSHNTPSTAAFAPSAAGSINYPNPINQNVTLTGVMTVVQVAPACSLSNPPCAISDSPLYYLTVNGQNYRLVFSNSTTIPLNLSRIMVIGVYVTPSTYKASQYTPQIHFRGDIYVIAYSYTSPYQ
jgi:hypothetical protein